MYLSRSLSAFLLAALLAVILGVGPTAAEGPTASAELPLALRPAGTLPLEGTPWRLRWYLTADGGRAPGPEVAATMRLQGGSLAGSGGCTAFRGSYGTVGRAIDFKLKGLKSNDCAEQTTMVQGAMVDALRKTAAYAIEPGDDGDELVLMSANGSKLLRFGRDDAGSLEPWRWRLKRYRVDGQQQSAAAEFPSDLTFDVGSRRAARAVESGSVLGGTGCNGFRATFSRQASVISFGPLDLTDAPCPDGLEHQQAAVLEVLAATSAYLVLSPDMLTLTADDGGTALEYRADPPIEGTTWLRAPVPAGDRDAWTSLRLEDGLATGSGPCGPYAGSYVSDGLFITFSDLRGTGVAECDRAKEERAFLAAMRSAVRLEPATGPGDPGFSLRDARDERVLRFVYPYSSP